ncbi:MAG: hypothetical protein J6V25_02410 [Oscillospiraceae bacterium]|nr:hypothetical protein [Oscillospiraceae bacterium]
MKRILALLLAAATVMSLFSGCGREIDNSGYVPTGDAILMEGQDPEDIMPEPEDTQELTLAYYPERSMNPLFGSDYTNRVLMSLMYQGLFAVDNKKNATPILAGEYYVSGNSRNWVVYLDSRAKFSDGTPVTPQDVIATYEKAMENDYYKGRFFHLVNVGLSEDGNGILFQMDTPYENLALLLDIPIVKASEVEAELPLGTGPYAFVTGLTGAHLQRVADWWCGSTKLPATDLTIDLVEVSTPAEVRDAFQFNGDKSVSVVCTNPMSDSFAEYSCDYELWEIESGYFMYLGCNILYSPFFDDGTLRTFLTYAIDRVTLAQDAYKGMVYPVTLPCSPTEVYYSTTLASAYQYDSLKFINKMASYRVPQKDGMDQQMRLLVNSDDSARVRIARSIAATLTDLGLPTKTLECNGYTYREAVRAQNFDLYLGMTRLSPTMDLTEYFRPWGELGWGGLAHETLYSMSLNALENSGNYYNLYKKLAEDGRIIPIMFGYYAVYAQRGLMPDLNPSRDNVFYYSLGKTMEGIKMDALPVVETEPQEDPEAA